MSVLFCQQAINVSRFCAARLQFLGEVSFNQLFFSFLRELSRFIAAGRLHCKIDKVNEIVETNRYVINS